MIPRFKWITEDRPVFVCMGCDDDGGWVRYEDHAAEVARLSARSAAVERLVDACKRLRSATDVGNWCDSAIKPGGCAWHISVEDNEALDAATDEVDAALAAVEKEIGNGTT